MARRRHDPGDAGVGVAAGHLRFRYGPEERAINFTGSAELTFGAHPHLDGDVSALQVDVDRALADPDVTNRPPLVVLQKLLADIRRGGQAADRRRRSASASTR